MTNNKKSIDDFVAKFHGLGGNTAPKVVPYTFEDVVAGLNSVVPNDWATFLRSRLDSHAYQAPLGGLENGGYKLTYADKPNIWSAMGNAESGTFNFWYSLGFYADKTGNIADVLKGGSRRQKRHRPRNEDHRRQRPRLLTRCPEGRRP